MPNTGTSPSRPATVSAAPATAAGSPGPLDRNTPSGPRASTSAAGVEAGTTSTKQPTPARGRRIVALMPKSLATTWNMASGSPAAYGGSAGDPAAGIRASRGAP